LPCFRLRQFGPSFLNIVRELLQHLIKC
jgi:hypothetical protein